MPASATTRSRRSVSISQFWPRLFFCLMVQNVNRHGPPAPGDGGVARLPDVHGIAVDAAPGVDRPAEPVPLDVEVRPQLDQGRIDGDRARAGLGAGGGG